MAKSNILRRVFFTSILAVLLAQPALPQSVLNFPRVVENLKSVTGITIVNRSPHYADMQFDLYGMDGKLVAAGAVRSSDCDSWQRVRLDHAVQMTGLPVAPSVNGWIRVDSPNLPLNGVLVLDRGVNATAVPMEVAPLDRIQLLQLSETSDFFNGIALMNTSETQGEGRVVLVRPDGRTAAEGSLVIPAGSKVTRHGSRNHSLGGAGGCRYPLHRVLGSSSRF